ncbi:TonB-dependent receptor [Bacteroidia bacterium]|nr:TonB-dependent receptor [Bacteroidia bacterium]
MDVDAVIVSHPQGRRYVLEVLDSKLLNSIAGTDHPFENVLKVLPGVQSGNELSAQYAVRGNSIDDNLVYVNGVEIFRPMLTRTGQQEGLSFINPQLVSSAEFSTGGFLSEFGDKMSSVLNVQYKRPTTNGGNVEGSLLGASASYHFYSPRTKLSGAVGLRYKRYDYLLGTLDTKGMYNPTFADIQSILHYDFSSRLSLHFLGSFALNRYDFAPVDRKTTFGTLTNPVTFMMYNEGGEHDTYSHLLGALTLRYTPHSALELDFTASGNRLNEQERLDILSEYWFTETSAKPNSDNLDVGALREHARNYLDLQHWQLSHNGAWHNDWGNMKWGLQSQFYTVNDRIEKWQLLDSAGYIVPRSNDLTMNKFLNKHNTLFNQHHAGYVQQSFDVFFAASQQLRFTPSLRVTYSAANNECLVSPRFQAIWFPQSERQLQFYFSTGWYQQPPFYKEMRDSEAILHTHLTAQKAVHFVLGTHSLFSVQQIPCKFTAEVYYKHLYDLVPYMQDNVDIAYFPQHTARGRIYGLDVKLNFAMLQGVDSWVSLSLMKAQQNIANDGSGWLPMPNDQRINLSAMVQDRAIMNSRLQAYLLGHYGSTLPVFVPNNSNNYAAYRQMPAYSRIDFGVRYVLFDETISLKKNTIFSFLKSCVFTIEVLNLFDQLNTSSYLWVPIANSNGTQMAAVPNYLTARRLNFKIAIGF